METLPTKEKGKTLNELATELGLNPNQKMFSELYASDREFFGNGVQSYLEAYDPPRTKPNWYEIAAVSASQLLRNPKVAKYINALLEMGGLNDNFVDKQLEFLITQHSDFKSKLGAITEYNKLKKRIDGTTTKTLILNVNGETAKRYGLSSDTEQGSD